MSKPNTSSYLYGIAVMIAGFSLHFYYVREVAASMILFSLASFGLTLIALGAFLMWHAGKQVRIWARPAARQDEVALSSPPR